MAMSPHPLGCRLDLPHERPKIAYRFPRSMLASDLPSSGGGKLTRLILSILDQLQLGACVPFSWQQAWRMLDVAAGVAQAGVGSCLYPYLYARIVDYCLRNGLASLANPADRAAFLAQDSDAGTSHASCATAFQQYGNPPEAAWPYSDTNTGSSSDLFRVWPSEEAVRLAMDQRLCVAQSIDAESDDARVLAVRHAVAIDDQPVLLGCQVSNAFTRLDFDPNVPLLPPTSDIAGGHAMLIEDYWPTESDVALADGSVLAAGSVVYLVCNSWNTFPGPHVPSSYAPDARWGTDRPGRVLFTEKAVLASQLTVPTRVSPLAA